MSSLLKLYNTQVHHRRLVRPLHRLQYRVTYFAFSLSDGDQMKAAMRFTPYSLSPTDYGFATWGEVESTVKQKAANLAPDITGKVTLMTLPRFFGRSFNPISLFVLHDSADKPAAIVYDVRNTFGDRHYYAADLTANRHQADKKMHVSPFLDNEGHYRFNFQLDEQQLHLGITKIGSDGPELYARMNGQEKTVSPLTLWKTALSVPAQGIGILAAIHWEALKLWFKGAQYHPYDTQPAENAQPQPIKTTS